MSDPGADYRDAKAALPGLMKAWADAELAKVAWLRSKRGVPAHVLYDATTGEANDPALRDLEAAETKAHEDVLWGKALVVACGEILKGSTFDKAQKANEAARKRRRRPSADRALTKVKD